MARHKLPIEKARVTGADRDRKRHGGRTEPSVPPIGVAPARLTGDALDEWNALVSEIPWLKQSDRAMVELTAVVLVRTRHPDASAAAFTAARQALACLGATPVDRQRVAVPDDDAALPGSEYLN